MSGGACAPPGPSARPTAQTSVVETAATAKRVLFAEPTFGLATTLHAVPFQCSVSVSWRPVASVASPTAQTSLAETLATAGRTLPATPGLGLGMTVQAAASATSAVRSRGISTAATTHEKR